jgi:two-component system response regulator RegX3
MSAATAADTQGMIAAPSAGILHRTALVVDDEAVVRTVLRRYFARAGWTVVEAETGEEALALLDAASAPGVVVCDLNLPGLSGATVCRRIAESWPALSSRIVITSGDPAAARREMEREALHCPVLGKPFSLAELARIVKAVAAPE